MGRRGFGKSRRVGNCSTSAGTLASCPRLCSVLTGGSSRRPDGTENLSVWNAESGGSRVRSRSRCGSCPRRGFQPGRADARVCPRERNRHPWDSQTGKKAHHRERPRLRGGQRVFDCDSKWLATAGGRDHSAYVWDVQTERKPVPLDFAGTERAAGRVREATFSPDGHWLPRSDTGTRSGPA